MDRRLLFILLLLVSIARAQPYTGKAVALRSYHYFEVKDGLPQMQVMSLAEDVHGFIWVATKGGVARWDGSRFTTWNSRTPHFTASSFFNVLPLGDSICLARSVQRIWQIRGLRTFPLELPDPVSFIGGIALMNNHELFIKDCVYGGRGSPDSSRQVIYDYASHAITRRVVAKGEVAGLLSDTSFYTRYTVPDGQRTRYCLYLYVNGVMTDSLAGLTECRSVSPADKEVAGGHYVLLSREPGFAEKPLQSAFEVLADGHKLQLREVRLRVPVHVSWASGLNWVHVTDISFYYVDPSLVLHFVHGFTDEPYCPVGLCNAYLLDHSGNLWMGTEQGLFCFYKNTFSQYTFGFAPGSNDNVWSITKNSAGLYYLAVYGKGIYEFNDHTRQWKSVPVHLRDNALDVANRARLSSGTFAATRLWDGNALLPLTRGFAVKNKAGIRAYLLGHDDAEIYATAVDTIHHCAYITAYNHAYRLNADYSLDTLGAASDAGLGRIMSCTLLPDGTPLFSGRSAANSLVSYDAKGFQALPMHHKGALSMATDHTGGVWILASDSLYYYKNSKLQYVPVSATSLLLSVKVYNEQWLMIGGTNEFILMDMNAWFSKNQPLCFLYNYNNGFNAIECSQNSMLVDDDGSVWVPTAKNIMRFNPLSLARNNVLLAPNIDDISFAGQNLQWTQDTSFAGSVIQKSYPLRNIQITYIAANVSGAGRVFYRYRLAGYSDEWSSTVTTTTAVFNNLPPGSYRFQVQASFNGIDWSPVASTPGICLVPRFTERPAFSLLVLLGIIIAVIAATARIIKLRNSRRLNAQEQEMQMLSLKLQSIRSKAIPHFTGNVFNNIDFLIAKQQYDDASKYLAYLSRLYSYILLQSDKPANPLGDELKFVNNYIQLEKLRFKDKLQYVTDIDGQTDMSILIPNMVLHTYVENAVKHGLMSKKGFGTVSVTVESSAAGVWISVTDDGIGRAAAAGEQSYSTGTGLRILAQQIDIYNQRNVNKIVQKTNDLLSPDGRPAGTQFLIFIPKNYSFT